MQVCALGWDELEAHHFLALEGPRIHRSAGHPEEIVDDVDSGEIQIRAEEGLDVVLHEEDVVVCCARDGW
jgi:hypothetical protein